MNTNILSVRFFVKKYKVKDNLVPVYVRISVDGRSADASLKKEIELTTWNPDKGQAIGTRSEIKSFNAYLDQVEIPPPLITFFRTLSIISKA